MPEPQNNTPEGCRCPECGSELPDNLPPDLCPKCLLNACLTAQPETGPIGTTLVSADGRSRGLPQPGEQLGHYLIVRSLGGGGMGTVFEAEELETGRRVALKVLSHALDSPQARERFIREGRLAGSINHPNSVYVFGTEELGGTPAIAMELVAGGTLEDRVRTCGPMPPAEAVDAVLQIIAGLEAAHRIGILHRDVKPSNCFVDVDGTVKIGDFGLSISTAVRVEPALTAAGSFLGTPAFCSPEQVRGEEPNARSDMYSVGATLFYLLTGRAPFQAKNSLALIAAVLEQPAPPPGQFRPNLPRGLSNGVLRCLEKQPGDRFKNYEELRQAIALHSSAARVPASLGCRFAASMVDQFVVCPVVVIPLIFEHFKSRLFPGSAAIQQWLSCTFWLLPLVCLLLYYALLEGCRGAGLGKLAFGLRVVGPDNSPPGFFRALPRSMLGMASGLAPLLFCTARRGNGFAAVHDLLTNTRVISRAALKARPTPALAQTSPPSLEAKPRIGPYHILDTLEDSAGTVWLLGYDIRLLRKVWIRSVPAGTLPVPPPLRNLGRVGRLRWLAGRRSPQENWDAFEALNGQPLLRLLRFKPQSGQDAAPPSTPQPWAQVRYWLCDLAAELSAAQKDGTLPPFLGLDRVWITGDGRAKLLDFPAPGAPAPAAGASLPSPPMPNSADASRFLGQIAAAALEGRAEAAAKPPGEVSVSLPLHVRKFLWGLPQLPDAGSLLLALQPLLHSTVVVTRLQRAAAAAACLVVALTVGCLVSDALVPADNDILTNRFYATLAAFACLPALVALVFRGGPILFATGVAFVRRDGTPASRGRLFWRATVAWSPAMMVLWALATPGISLGRPWLILGVVFGLAFLSVALPRRGLQDRLAGTWPVPR
ncbi:MAG: protein kinase domain-containing protein [Limisphaerales bacterium]